MTSAPAKSSGATGTLLLGWLAYVAFVVYGSLVPLDYHPLPFAEAVARFKSIPYLALGVQSRADWVSNGVLYVPVGFLTVALFGAGGSLLRRLPLLFGALAFSFALAVGVEFTQVFFPPRTVSLNDIYAECIGSVLGIVLAFRWADWLQRALTTWAGKFDQLATFGLQAYAVLYVAFSFFPYDFLLSAAELGDKIDSGAWGWLLAGEGVERGKVVLAAKLFAETLAVLPIGLMLGRWNASRHMPVASNGVLLGLVLGLFIEVVQFFIYSGTAQGASVFTRAAGMHFGAVLWRERARLHGLRPWLSDGRRLALLIGAYGLALVAVNGVFDHAWQGGAAATASLAETRFLPFYYHYYTTEQAALLSLTSVALMYAPLGGLAWLRRWPGAVAALLAGVLALAMEGAKLFLVGLHADPTNLLVAAVAAWATARLAARLSHDHPTPAPAPPPMAMPAAAVQEKARSHNSGAGVAASTIHTTAIAGAAVLGLVAWVAIDFPVASLALAAGLLAYAALLWRRPQSLWFAIPLALPLLDLAPWSGRFYLDEFDYLVMVSLLVGFVRIRAVPGAGARDRLGQAMVALLTLVFAIGAVRGLLPWQWPDLNSFNNYHSPWNALRLFKGVLWAVLLWLLAARASAAGQAVRPLFATGMVAGLAGVVAVVVWERAMFPGLIDFATEYRVTGPFSAMHVGGADIETFITLAIPFAVLMLTEARSWAMRLAAGAVILGATYALMVTFSRAGYAGFAVAVAVATLFAVRRRWQEAAGVWRWAVPAVVVAVVVGGVVAIALPVFSGSFAQERVASSGKDFGTRVAHWRDTLAMRDDAWMTDLFGMGLGRFPETHYWRSSEPRAGGYRLERENNDVFLRLGTGYPLYIEQFVITEPQHEYRLRVSVRAPRPDAGVTVVLCEKWLLTSGDCWSQTLLGARDPHTWLGYDVYLPSGALRPPMKLAFFNASTANVDIDNIELATPEGKQLLSNGNFSQGLDRWYFSTDKDLPWHVWSLPVAVLFELGGFGVIALAMVMVFALKRHAQAAWRGDAAAVPYLAALPGLLVIAGVDTMIDAPRIMLMFAWVCFAGFARNTAASQQAA